MLTCGMCRPFLCGRNFGITEDIGHIGSTEKPALVHKAAQVGRLGNIRRGCHDTVGQCLRGFGEVEQNIAKGCLC